MVGDYHHYCDYHYYCDYHHYCDYHLLGSCCGCCSRARHFLHARPKWLCKCSRLFILPYIVTLNMFMQVCRLFVVLVFQCAHLPPGTHWCRIYTLGTKTRKGEHTKAIYQLAAWHWACILEDERTSYSSHTFSDSEYNTLPDISHINNA